MRRKWMWISLTIALYGLSVFAQSVPTTPTQAPNVTPPGPQRRQAPARQQPSIARRPQLPARTSSPGTITGYVYWDTHSVQHKPPLSCSGLTVTVGVGTPPSGSTPTFEQYKTLGTYSSFTYLNNVSTLGVCAYAVHQVPVGQDLQVKIGVAPSAFSAVVSPGLPPTSNDVDAPYKIISGKCNNLPPAVPSPADLGSHWWTCGNYAYNVNFVLEAPAPAPR